MTITRGIRNNNPTNIRKGASKWIGLCPEQSDPEFCQFVSAADGIRAAFVLIRNHIFNKDYNLTLHGLCSIWAPPSENDTEKYAETVSRISGVPINAALIYSNRVEMAQIMRGIITMENGCCPYPSALIYQAYTRSVPSA